MKRYSLLLIIFSVAIFWSCDDDFLNTESTDLSDDLVWADPELAEIYILNLYTSIRLSDKEPNKGEGSAGLTRGHHWAMFSSVTDETVYSNDDATYIIQTGGMTPSNFGFVGTSWGRNYVGIRECNDALARIPELDVSEQKKNELLAEVRFIRAARYFELLRGYGGVSLIGDVVPGLSDDFSALYDRATINETVQYILDELDYSIANLPTKSNQQIGRASSESAMGYKARTLLYAASPLYTSGAGGDTNNGLNGGSTTTWQEAADAANDIISLNRFSLVDDLDADPSENYRLLFLQDDTREDLFLRDYNATSRAFNGLEKMNAPNSLGGWAGNCPMQNFVDDFEMEATGLPISDPASGYDENNPYDGRDPRFYASVVHDGADYRGTTIDITVDAGAGQNLSRTGYFIKKFMDLSSNLDDWDNTGRETPWRYIRYAEVLLNFAEAQNEAVGPDVAGSGGLTATQAVNLVRNRSGMPDLVGLNQSELRERIRNERRVELSFEEHRYYDVRRWLIAESTEGVEARKVVRTDTGYDFSQSADNMGPKDFSIEHYWIPIPQNDITISRGQLTQNPNYN
ncbi:MAG: RagB/SusD family nutrient uptake outer membrane protein [Marinoscillum sp.]